MASTGGDSALMDVVRSCDLEELKRILEEGFDPDDGIDSNDEDQTRPLHRAAAMGNLEAVKLLVEHGAGLDTIDIDRTPIMCAAGGMQVHEMTEGQIETIRYLADKGAKLNPFGTRITAIMEAVRRGARGTLETLLELGARLSKNGQELEEAADRGNPEIVALLARAVGDMESAQAQLDTGLLGAARSGRADAARVLLEAGANVNSTDDKGKTPLHWNAMWGKGQRLELCDTLVAHGADLDALDGDEVCPLVWAIAGKHDDLPKRLIEAGANINRTDTFPPLFQAAFAGKQAIVELLLEAGADRSLVHDGKTAADWAREKRHSAVVALLE